MHDQAAGLRDRLKPRQQVAEVWAVATVGGERSALAFAREIHKVLRPARLTVCLWGERIDEAQVVLLPAGEGLKGVRRAFMRGAHTWLLLSSQREEGLAECSALLEELCDRSLRAVYLALSGPRSVSDGEAAVAAFAERVSSLPYHPQPFGFYGPNEHGDLTLAPAVLRRFFAERR